eukprot:jgi/Picre1/28279/NNA_003685.t1
MRLTTATKQKMGMEEEEEEQQEEEMELVAEIGTEAAVEQDDAEKRERETVRKERAARHREKFHEEKDAISFPVIPEYVFEPICQRDWGHAVSGANRQGAPGVSGHDSDSEIEIDRNKEQGDAFDPLGISFALQSSIVKSWEKEQDNKHKDDLDKGLSVVGSNDILGTAPLLRRALRGIKSTDVEEKKSDIRKSVTSWSRDKPAEFFYDLNDPHLVFEMEDGTKSELGLYRHAQALLMNKESRRSEIPEVQNIQDPKKMLKAINISKDEVYFAAPRRKGTGRVGRTVYHSKFATLLHTIPLDLSEQQALHWHRPRSVFAPLDKKTIRQPSSKEVKVTLWTLFPRQSQKTFHVEDPAGTKISDLWNQVKTVASAFEDAKEIQQTISPKFFLPGNPPTEVQPDANLLDPIFERSSTSAIGIVVVYQDVDWFKTKVAEKIPEESSTTLLRPPFVFSTRRELKAGQCGSIFLVEYMEEFPMLLNHPGMGARLTTYYRKKSSADQGHLSLKDKAEKSGCKWKTGAVVGLGDDDESPFLGQVSPGNNQLAFETGLATCPAYPYNPNPTDFLVTRSVAGTLRVREVQGTFICGQELPLHRIPPPNTRSLKDLQERRIHVYVMRTLRTEQARIERERTKAALEGRGFTEEIPCVSLLKTSQMFKGRPINMIRMFFKECNLKYVSKNGHDEFYTLAHGARIPTEAELKKMVSPEDACVTEATFAAQIRLKQRGIYNNDAFGGVVPEKLRLAAEMLPDDPDIQMAAKAVWSMLYKLRLGLYQMRL